MVAAGYFDDWYAAMGRSDRQAEIQLRMLGLPPDLESSSLLSWDGIADVVERLAVGPGDTLVDLACGRGGYGREVASRTGAILVGVDFSRVAVEHARSRAPDATYLVGDLTATTLAGASAQAVMCVDAMQFADPYESGLAECLRVLAPGGRLVLTGWQAIDPGDENVPVRLRHDIGKTMRDSGFADVTAIHLPAWRAVERALWTAAVAADPDGDPAMQSLHDEGVRSLPRLDRRHRILATGTRP